MDTSGNSARPGKPSFATTVVEEKNESTAPSIITRFFILHSSMFKVVLSCLKFIIGKKNRDCRYLNTLFFLWVYRTLFYALKKPRQADLAGLSRVVGDD